jgi:hypothetical protein
MTFVLQFERGQEYITEFEADENGRIWFDQSVLEDLVWHFNCGLDSSAMRLATLEVVLPPGVESKRTCC